MGRIDIHRIHALGHFKQSKEVMQCRSAEIIRYSSLAGIIPAHAVNSYPVQLRGTAPDQRKNRRSAGPLLRWQIGFLFTAPARRDSPERMWGFSEEAA